MRLLFCTPVTPDFLHPLVGLALELRGRGHEVAFATGALAEGVLAEAGIARIPCAEAGCDTFRLPPWSVQPVIEAEVRHLEHAIRAFAPDVLVASEIAFSAFIPRERTGLPLCVLGMAEQLGPRAEALIPLNEVRGWFGLPPHAPEDPRFPLTCERYLLRSAPELEADLPPEVALVGACAWAPEAEVAAARREVEAGEDGRPLVVVHHRHIPEESRWWPELAEALAGLPVRAAAEVAAWDQRPDTPPGWVVRAVLPGAAVLDRARLVVCGARSALPLAALEHGVPSLVVRGEDDAEGEHVEGLVRADCALRLRVDTPEALREAVARALADEALHAAARRIGAGFARLGGFGAAADAVEGVHAWRGAASEARGEPAGV